MLFDPRMHDLEHRRSGWSTGTTDRGAPAPGKRTLTSRLTTVQAKRAEPAPGSGAAPDLRIARRAADGAPAHGFDLDRFLDFDAPQVGGLVQRASNDAGVAPDAEAAVGRAAQGRGSELPGDVRAQFERGLGADLGAVRVHTGGSSAEAAQAVGAKAYATGQDIHFAAGQYQPSTADGLHLLAHEVAHTVQQAGGAASGRQHQLEVSAPGDALEREADRVADALVAGGTASVSSAPGGGLHREPAPAEEDPNTTEVKTKVKALCARDFGGDYKKGFDHFDANHDGQCEQSEVIALLKAADCKFTGKAAVATWPMIANGVIAVMDTNKDGKISYAEFDAAINAAAPAPAPAPQ